MNYAKKAASQSEGRGRGRGRGHPGQAHNSPKEQDLSLYNRFKSSRSDYGKKAHEPRVLRPVSHGGFLQRAPPKFGGPGLTNRFSDLKIDEETVEEKKERVIKLLKRCESPFVWRPTQGKPLCDPHVIIPRLQQKHNEIVDEKKFKWRQFILKLVISYEYFRAKDFNQSLEILTNLETTLNSLGNSCCNEWLFLGILDALCHVVYTSQAVLCLGSDLEKAEKLIPKIQPVNTMKRSAQAGIRGIRAAVFMEYGHKGNKKALSEAQEAVELDRTSPEWHFLVGKCMGRIRRVAACHDLVDTVEVKAIDKALDLDKNNALYKVYLGQVLREKAFREYKKDKPKFGTNQYKRIEKMNWKAFHTFKEAMTMRPDCPHMLMRCAYGLIKLPNHMIDLKLTRETIDKALELAPNNPQAHHVKGIYYERFHVETDVALKHMEKAAELKNFGAAMDLVRMHHLLRHTNIIEELEAVAAAYEEPCKVQVVYVQAGSYMLFIKKDLVGAIKYFNKVIEMDPDSYAMKSHKPLFIRTSNPLNMFDVLLGELDSNTNWDSFDVEDKKVLKIFRIKARNYDSPDKKERLSVQEILETSKKRIEKDKKDRENFLNENWKKKWWKAREKKKGPWKPKKGKNAQKKETGSENKISQESSCQKKNRKSPNRVRDLDNRKGAGVFTQITRERTSSYSSVDSDYQRNSTVYGSRGFFLGDSNENLSNTGDNRYRFGKDLEMNTQYSTGHEQFSLSKSFSSRDSSVCSTSSSEIDHFREFRTHVSRYSPKNASNNEKGEENQLTVENLKGFDSADSNYLGPRSSSQWSLASAGSGYQTSDSEKSLSVMDRVKQSYAMLGRESNKEEDKGKKKHLYRSGSTHSLNVKQNAPNNQGNFKKKENLQRSGSTQSLNVQQPNPIKEKMINDYKQAFHSRNLGKVNSAFSSIMPSFASKKPESDQ